MDGSIVQAQRLIEAHFPLVPVPSLPEIVLHRAVPTSGLWRLAEVDEKGFGNPYWAYFWGGGLALARYVLDHSRVVTGLSVLDLGTGSGLVAIAAAKAGAKDVVAVDIDRYAAAAVKLNAAKNDVVVSTVVADILDGPPPDADAILVGDLFYESDLAGRVTRFLERCAKAGISILIGDPLRAYLPRPRLRLVMEYPQMDFASPHPSLSRNSGVFTFVSESSSSSCPISVRMRAFSSEVETGSRKENASKQKREHRF